jgi:hypothetical protein
MRAQRQYRNERGITFSWKDINTFLMNNSVSILYYCIDPFLVALRKVIKFARAYLLNCGSPIMRLALKIGFLCLIRYLCL